MNRGYSLVRSLRCRGLKLISAGNTSGSILQTAAKWGLNSWGYYLSRANCYIRRNAERGSRVVHFSVIRDHVRQ